MLLTVSENWIFLSKFPLTAFYSIESMASQGSFAADRLKNVSESPHHLRSQFRRPPDTARTTTPLPAHQNKCSLSCATRSLAQWSKSSLNTPTINVKVSKDSPAFEDVDPRRLREQESLWKECLFSAWTSPMFSALVTHYRAVNSRWSQRAARPFMSAKA